ncbi:ArsA family ATPase [Candidatus Formimonas warabiya]|uniref:ArsA/GET3 Anion-transporting ATPase-like domain-containing protein n=1 Tax=Formimonas warabiya TaxID=1761012 RepID=A0A3G1KWX9_FORW1|nr:ArsA family ATPase [Candidatus Formimonas warabiya]ATW26952.1 hypothetical protein DCMF_21265 [Candidatus Formimonas warabiya]
MSPLKFVLFCGKGGVGKTTMAASSAIYFALSGKKTLLFSTDPAHSLSDSLSQQIGSRLTGIKGVENLFAWEQDAEELMNELKNGYGEGILHFLTSCTYLDETDAQDLMDLTLPGLDELMGLKQIIDYLESDQFDLYVWDAAPTGHTLRLLQMPEIVDQWIKLAAQMRWKYRSMVGLLSGKDFSDRTDDFVFNLKKSIKKLNRYLTDPSICRMIAVTIPEYMAVNELDRMSAYLKTRSFPLRHILINQVIGADNQCLYCQNRRQEQEKYLQRIRVHYPGFCLTEVFQRPHEVKGRENLIDLHGEICPLLGE